MTDGKKKAAQKNLINQIVGDELGILQFAVEYNLQQTTICSELLFAVNFDLQ